MTQKNIDDYISDSSDQEEAEEEDSDSGTSDNVTRNKHVLSGLRANDPLAFLAALGTVRSLTKNDQVGKVALSWSKEASYWTPILHLSPELNREELLRILADYLTSDEEAVRYTLAPDGGDPINRLSNIEANRFREVLQSTDPGSEDERTLAAYATDAFVDHPDIAEFQMREEGTALTRLNVLEYAGPKEYLRAQRRLLSETTKEKLHRTLFDLWDFDDDASRHRTMRWSPSDNTRGAYTGVDPTHMPSQTMHGANRLAIEGSRMYTVIPQMSDSATVGFVSLDKGEQVFQYPLWTKPIHLEVIRTLMSHPQILTENPSTQAIDGVEKILRAQIEVKDWYRNLGRGIPVSEEFHNR